MKDIIYKNWAFISGCIMAIVVALQQFVGQPEPQLLAVLVAVGIAVLGYFGDKFRGAGMTSLGILGIAAYSFYTVYTTGAIDWIDFLIMFLTGVGSLALPNPKKKSYETDPTIARAKR